MPQATSPLTTRHGSRDSVLGRGSAASHRKRSCRRHIQNRRIARCQFSSAVASVSEESGSALIMSSGPKEGNRQNNRGHKLLTVHYAPAEIGGAVPTAVLIWHHGYGEHVGRYKWVFSRLASAGIAVHSFDAHGHGRSEPSHLKDRGFVRSYTDLVDDLDAFAADVAALYPAGTPQFLGGQSMGGLIALHSALRNQCRWRGIVLTSAAVNVEWTPVLKVQAKLGNILAALIPRARIVPAVRPEDMSPDKAVVQDYVSDPLNFVGKLRSRTGNELLKGFQALETRESELALPVLALHGTSDHTTSISAVKRLLKNCCSTDATFNEITGGYHELLHGPEKEEVAQCIADWILARSISTTEEAQRETQPTLPEVEADAKL